jgi:hypothetical protein
VLKRGVFFAGQCRSLAGFQMLDACWRIETLKVHRCSTHVTPWGPFPFDKRHHSPKNYVYKSSLKWNERRHSMPVMFSSRKQFAAVNKITQQSATQGRWFASLMYNQWTSPQSIDVHTRQPHTRSDISRISHQFIFVPISFSDLGTGIFVYEMSELIPLQLLISKCSRLLPLTCWPPPQTTPLTRISPHFKSLNNRFHTKWFKILLGEHDLSAMCCYNWIRIYWIFDRFIRIGKSCLHVLFSWIFKWLGIILLKGDRNGLNSVME